MQQPAPKQPNKYRRIKPDACLHPDTLLPIVPKTDFFATGLFAMAAEAWEAAVGAEPPPPPPASRFIAAGPVEERTRRDADGHHLPPDDGGRAERAERERLRQAMEDDGLWGKDQRPVNYYYYYYICIYYMGRTGGR